MVCIGPDGFDKFNIAFRLALGVGCASVSASYAGHAR
jgi:hypothetical protein